MASITVTKLDEHVKEGLKARASSSGRSMAEEARLILSEAIEKDLNVLPERGLGTAIHEIFKPFGGVKLNLPPRKLPRKRLDFS